MAGPPSRRHFVGRAHELAMIAEACAATAADRAQLVVVRGEAGVGKTTLCQQAAERAANDGFTVAWGTCWADGGSPPLWPWPAVLADLGALPAAQSGIDVAAGGVVDPGRFEWFTAVGDLLEQRTLDGPVMVVIDDIHVADTAAVLLARYVLRALDRRPILMLVTRRSQTTIPRPESARLLDELEQGAVVLPLASFNDRDTAALLAVSGLHAEDDALVPALARLTGGNPLLLARAVAHAPRSDLLAGVEHVIGDALNVLEPEHRDVVALAATLGTESAGADIARLVGGDPREAYDALAGAASAGLMDVRSDRWVFTHELVRRAALGLLTPAELLDVHARAARLAPHDDRPEAIARRAHHALAAAARSDADADHAVTASREAARVLSAGFDYERAAELLDAAVELAAQRSTPAEHVDVLLEWADALMVCGRLTDGRHAYERAVAAASAAGDPDAQARAALGLGGVWVNEHRGQAAWRRVLTLQRSALGRLGPESVVLGDRLRLRLAAEAVYDGAPVEPVREALAAVRASGDPSALAEALSLSHHALLAPEHLDERRRIADELIGVASAAGDSLRVLFGLLWKAVDLYHAGDVEADRTLSELRRRADAVGCRSIAYIVAAIDVMRMIRDGRLDDAEAAAHECFAAGVDVGDADATGYYGLHLLTIRWLQDRDGELIDLARDVAASDTLVNPEFGFRAGTAAVAARAGFAEEARAWLRGLGPLAALPRSSTWLAGMVVVVEAAWALGDADIAAEVYPLLEPFADRPAMPSLAVSCFGSVERALGLAACLQGDLDLAVEHLRRAVRHNAALGHRPLTALARAELALVLERRAGPGDRAAAHDALRTAVDASDGMGMDARVAQWGQRALALTVSTATAILQRRSANWVVDIDARRVVVPDLVGVGYLGDLLARPGDEIDAVDLCGGVNVDGGRQDVVDRDTLDAYRRRVRELDHLLDDARAAGRARNVERLEAEREQLRQELSNVLAVSGRSRPFNDTGERARTAVRKAIARAIDVIAASDGELARELRATITTGRRCSYTPDPIRPRRWSVLLDD